MAWTMHCLCWVVFFLAKSHISHFANYLALRHCRLRKQTAPRVANPTILQLCLLIIERCTQLAPPFPLGLICRHLWKGHVFDLCPLCAMSSLWLLTHHGPPQCYQCVHSRPLMEFYRCPSSLPRGAPALALGESCFLTVNFCISSSVPADVCVLC